MNMRKIIMKNFRIAILTGPMIAAVLLTGCMVGPKYNPPAATVQPPPVSYKEVPPQAADTSEWKVGQPQDAMLRGKWWEIYNDPELNTLEDQLDINNQNIKQAFENFMEARTLIAQARSQLYPTLSVGPTYTYSHPSANLKNTIGTTGSAGNTSATGSPPNSELATLPFSASWEPDLWGKVRNLIHEQQYNAQLSAADLENEKLTEQASLAVFLFELRGQDALQKVLDETVEVDKQSVDLTRSRFETGVDDEISLVEAQNVLDNAKAAATNLGILRAQYEHAIAVLIGTVPSGFSLPVKPLDAAPPPIPLGVP